jgi:anti-sigma regulatory factor (Ser/Thr protein kinase)
MISPQRAGAGAGSAAAGQDGCVRLPHPPTGLERGTQWRRVFPGEGRQLEVLRRWLASLLPDSEALDDLVLVATELASNAICHTASGQGGRFAVEVTRCRSVVRIGVTDGGGPGRPRVIEDPAAERGRGLLLVRALSVRTGACRAGAGRLVWADVRWDAGAPATAQDGSAAAPPSPSVGGMPRPRAAGG